MSNPTHTLELQLRGQRASDIEAKARDAICEYGLDPAESDIDISVSRYLDNDGSLIYYVAEVIVIGNGLLP